MYILRNASQGNLTKSKDVQFRKIILVTKGQVQDTYEIVISNVMFVVPDISIQ
jgi:hypothetical protein